MKNNEGLTAHSLAFNNNHVRIVTLIDNALNLMQEEEGERGEKVADDPHNMWTLNEQGYGD